MNALRLTLLTSVLALGLVVCHGCSTTKPQPHIDFDSTTHDFKSVEEGTEVRHTFVVKNTGNADLKIAEAKSTCGCTTVNLQKNVVTAGGTTTIDIMIDTALKQGHIDREITLKSNDPVKPMTSLFLKADIKDPHAMLGANVQSKIFQGRCAVCHVNEGIGKTGEDLYLADCAMCHGFKAQGGFAPALNGLNVENKIIAKRVRKVIAEGSPTHRSMPAYAKEKGGPLTAAEIDSLIEYLKWRRKQDKAG